MKDERVRPASRYKTQKGWKNGKPGKYDHKSMEGVSCWVDEKFKLPSGATTQYPGGSGVAGEDINCRCYLSYKLKKIEKGLGAGQSDFDILEHPEPKEIENIDFNNKNLIKSKLENYEKQIVNDSVENAIVITRDGKVIQCIGTQNQVFPNTDIGENLKGAYLTHNHPIDETHYSFSADDLVLFMKYKLPEMRGVDLEYTYRLVRTEYTQDLDSDTVNYLFGEEYYHRVMEMEFMGEIDGDVDEYHEIIKMFAEKCGFVYERRPRR